jgi:hypothetical protein
MSNRVEQEQARAAEEAERLQKRIDKETRETKSSAESRERFSQLLKTGQKTAEHAKDQGEKTSKDARQSEQQGTKQANADKNAERAARMARGGTLQHQQLLEKVKGFEGTLQSQKAQTDQTKETRVQRREDGTRKDRVEGEDRKTDLERKAAKKDDERELSRVEAREKHRPNAAIDGDKKGGDSRGGDGGAAAKMPQQATKTAGPQKAREAKQLPPEVKKALEKLVDAIYLAVNEKGLKEFHVELKEGVLSGGSLKVSVGDDGVALSFRGLDGNQKNLVESSKGDLMKRLEGRGLKLAKIEVA